jgi:hypothetical protein
VKSRLVATFAILIGSGLMGCGQRASVNSRLADGVAGNFPLFVALSSWANPADNQAYSIFVASPLDLAPGVQLCFATPDLCQAGQGVRMETNRRTNDAGVVYFRPQKYARLGAPAVVTVLATTTAGQPLRQVVQIGPRGR